MIVICIFLFALSLYVVKLEKNRSLMLSIGIIFFIELVWAIVSCAYLDFSEAYILETGRTSYHTGAFLRMICLYSPFIIIMASKNAGKFNSVYKRPLYVKKINRQQCIRYILIFTLIIILYCVVDMIISGIPLFSNVIGRQNYSKYSKLPFVMKINGEVTFFGLIVAGIAFFREKDKNKTNKNLALIIMIISIVYRFMMEYKYHGMYNIIFSFFIVGLIDWYKKIDYRCISIKNILKLVMVVSIILLLCYYTYTNVNKKFDAKSLLFDRIFALQAHTFWGMDEVAWIKEENHDGYKDALDAEIKAVLENLGQNDKESGIINVMFKVADSESVKGNIENGVRWAGSYLTIGINTIGYIGTFIISIIITFLVLFDIKMFYAALHHCEFVTLYLAQSLMWDLLDYFRVGNWCILLNLKTIIVFMLLIFMYILKIKNARGMIDDGMGDI